MKRGYKQASGMKNHEGKVIGMKNK